jgi:hypothetical protein
MQRTVATIVVGLGTALVIVGALSGCAAKVANGSASKSHSGSGSIAHPGTSTGPKPATATPSASASGPAPLPANALFRISATVTASNGAIADLVQTVYKPIAPDPSDTALLNSQCNYPGQPDFQGQPTWQSQIPGAVYLTSDMTATLHAGSPAFDNATDFVLFGFPGAPGAYSGSYGVFEAYCDSGYIQIPGSVHGVAPISPTDPVNAEFSWAGPNAAAGGYGFSGGGNDPGGPDLGGTAVVKNCSVQVSAAAIAAAPALAAWKTTAPAFDIGCTYIP